MRTRVADLTSGRVKQKLRTRDALVAAAIELVRQGRYFSVADVADAAGVGRTTAYRYFPTQEMLFAQAVLQFVGGADDRSMYHTFASETDPVARVDAVVTGSDASMSAHEGEYRAMLRLSLEQRPGSEDFPRRQMQRLRWLEDALGGARPQLGAAAFSRLVAALSLCVGIEAQVVLRDICMLKPAAAREVKRWAARALLRAALDEAAQPAKRKAPAPAARNGRKTVH